MKKILTASLLLSGLMALGASEITIEKPHFRWLWGGFGAMVRSFATDLGPMGIRVNLWRRATSGPTAGTGSRTT